MIEYTLIYLLIATPFLFSIFKLEHALNYKQQLIVFIFLLLAMIFMAGFRDMIGGYDIYVYKAFFNNASQSLNTFNYESGYYELNRFVSYFTHDYSVLLFVTSLLTWLFLGIACMRFRGILFILLFFMFCKLYLMGFVYIRQMLAVSIIAYSFYYIERRSYYISTFFILFASLFHVSGLLVFSLFILIRFKLNIKAMIIIYILTALVMLTPLKVAISSVAQLLVGGDVFNYAVNYLYLVESISLFLFLLIFNRLFITKTEIFYYLVSFIYVSLLLIAAKNGTMIRLTWYFLLPVFISISIVANKYNKIIYLLFGFIFSLIYFRTLFVWDGGDFVPYQTIFNDSIRPSRWNYLR